MGGCLLTYLLYDLLSVHWHMGFYLWVGFLLILSQAVMFVGICRL
jgi:hypothetical protein